MPRTSTQVINKNVLNKRKGVRNSGEENTGTINFICADGEGINVVMADGTVDHKYVLFGVGNDQIENPNGLEWHEILEFLYDHYQSQTGFCGFFLGYDFNRILCTMPMKKVERLITTEGRESRRSKSEKLKGKILPVDFPYGWQIDMLGMRRMQIRKRSCHCQIHYCKCPKGPWMTICDSGAFFQTAFMNVIDPTKWDNPIVSASEYALLEEGKKNRAYADKITEEMRFYNRMENDVLSRVLNTLNDGFRQMGVKLSPGQWFGPGQAAQKWMKVNKIPTADTVLQSVPKWFTESARMSYFGGWFEIFMHGIIPGDSHEYDINSAYPYIISQLPCLLHGKYTGGFGKPPVMDDKYTLVYTKVSSFKKAVPGKKYGGMNCIGTMLHRDSANRIFRPVRTEGWYWLHEIQAARKAGLIRSITYKQWMRYEPCNCPPPMEKVKELYELRLKVNKNSPRGKAAKLAYNSMYGKFAQSVGHPTFANPIYASLITAGCRTMILNAIASHPDGMWGVEFVATDAVSFINKHPNLPISSKLGEWDYKYHSNLTLFKPGVYWDDKTRLAIKENRKPSFKARGISAKDFADSLDEIDRQFEEWNTTQIPAFVNQSGWLPGWPLVEFTSSFSMISCLQAIRRHNWSLAGKVDTNIKLVQNSNPYDKRIGMAPEIFIDEYGNKRPIYRTFPWTLPIDDCKSKPYEKLFGMDDPWSQDRLELFGINPDGYIPELIAEALELRR